MLIYALLPFLNYNFQEYKCIYTCIYTHMYMASYYGNFNCVIISIPNLILIEFKYRCKYLPSWRRESFGYSKPQFYNVHSYIWNRTQAVAATRYPARPITEHRAWCYPNSPQVNAALEHSFTRTEDVDVDMYSGCHGPLASLGYNVHIDIQMAMNVVSCEGK